jgi:four helix bundle protein
MEYNLENRTALFAESIIELAAKIPKNVITLPLISQIVRSGTSVGANYCEANGASSKKDFRNKISICKKEIQETRYWLRILSKSITGNKDIFDKIADEARQLNLIFNKIVATIDKNSSLKIEN